MRSSKSGRAGLDTEPGYKEGLPSRLLHQVDHERPRTRCFVVSTGLAYRTGCVYSQARLCSTIIFTRSPKWTSGVQPQLSAPSSRATSSSCYRSSRMPNSWSGRAPCRPSSSRGRTWVRSSWGRLGSRQTD